MDDSNREQIESVEYWRALNPQASITNNPFPSNPTAYHVADDVDVLKQHLKKEGYFQTSPLVPEEDRNKLIQIIQNVIDADHRSTYALLYDEFYHVAAKLNNLLEPLLGKNHLLVPDEFEAYLIEPSDEDMGSAPHRDSLRSPKSIASDGMPSLINTWIALTDATPLNACMYVLPAHLDTGFPRPGNIQTQADQKRQEIPLQNIRAVPVKAGSVIGWSTSLLHWGGRSSNFATESRFSFAMYFQRGDVPRFHPTALEVPGEIAFYYRLYLTEKVWRDPEGRRVYEFL